MDRGQLRRLVGAQHIIKDKHLWGNHGLEAPIQAQGSPHRVLVGIHRWASFRVGVRVLGTRSTLLHFLVDFRCSYTGFALYKFDVHDMKGSVMDGPLGITGKI